MGILTLFFSIGMPLMPTNDAESSGHNAAPFLKTESPKTLTGRCTCSAVLYAVTDAFTYCANCHCQQCRRATGAAFKPFAGIERDQLRITQGTDQLRIVGDELGHDVPCPVCGSLMYSARSACTKKSWTAGKPWLFFGANMRRMKAVCAAPRPCATDGASSKNSAFRLGIDDKSLTTRVSAAGTLGSSSFRRSTGTAVRYCYYRD